MEATLHAAGGADRICPSPRTFPIRRPRQVLPDATSPDAPFEGAAGMQARLLSRPSNSTHAYRVRQMGKVPIVSARWDRVLDLKLPANEY